jgi:hypothetical protein
MVPMSLADLGRGGGFLGYSGHQSLLCRIGCITKF